MIGCGTAGVQEAVANDVKEEVQIAQPVTYPTPKPESEVVEELWYPEEISIRTGIIHSGRRDMGKILSFVEQSFRSPGSGHTKITRVPGPGSDTIRLLIRKKDGYISKLIGSKVPYDELHIVTLKMKSFTEDATEEEKADCLSIFPPTGLITQPRQPVLIQEPVDDLGKYLLYMGLSDQESQESFCNETRGYDVTIGIDMRFRDLQADDDVPYSDATDEYKGVIEQVLYGIAGRVDNLKSACKIYAGAVPAVNAGGIPKLPNPVVNYWDHCKVVANVHDGKIPPVKF